MRQLWFRSDQVGWNPHSYEWFFRRTPLGAAFRAREQEAIFDLLGPILEPVHSVLEVGCGTGNYTVPVARRCKRMVAVDSSPEMLQYLRQRLSQEELWNVQIRLGHLPEGLGVAEKFDVVLAVGVLNYVEGLEESLRVLASALKLGGWAVFNVPLATAEGRIYALTELLNRRRINSLSAEETVDLTEKVGLQVHTTAPTGLSRGGITLMVRAVAPPLPACGLLSSAPETLRCTPPAPSATTNGH